MTLKVIQQFLFLFGIIISEGTYYSVKFFHPMQIEAQILNKLRCLADLGEQPHMTLKRILSDYEHYQNSTESLAPGPVRYDDSGCLGGIRFTSVHHHFDQQE